MKKRVRVKPGPHSVRCAGQQAPCRAGAGAPLSPRPDDFGPLNARRFVDPTSLLREQFRCISGSELGEEPCTRRIKAANGRSSSAGYCRQRAPTECPAGTR